MTKIVSIILIICLIGGGVYFTKKNLKQEVSSGTPIAITVSETGTKKPLNITFPIEGLVVNAKYTMRWTGSAPKGVEKYYVYLINASSTKPILLGSVPSSDNNLNFTVSATTTAGIISGWKISMFSGGINNAKSNLLTETPSFIIANSFQKSITFYGGIGGPSTTPVHYGISISRDNVRPANPPKIKITCPTGVAALMPGTVDGDQCGKYLPTIAAPAKDNGFVYFYGLNLIFTNLNATPQTVSAETTVNGSVMTTSEVIIPPTNSAPFIPKG